MRVVLRLDAEPDGFRFDPRHPPPWADFEAGLRLLQEWRPRLEAATGAWPTFAWGIRVDEQIRLAYGEMGWALHRYAEALDRLRADGDDIGLHVHYYRPVGKAGRDWVIEYEDTAWTGALCAEALATFRRERGHDPAFFTSGNKLLDQATMDWVGRAGIPYDTSIEPGVLVPTRSWYRAASADYTRAPRQPYRPAPGDLLSPAGPGSGRQAPRGPVEVPCATGAPTLRDAPLPLALALRARVCQQQRLAPWRRPFSVLYLTQRPWQFRALLADLLRRGTPEVLHVPLRNCPRPDRAAANLATLAALPGARFAGFTGIAAAAPAAVPLVPAG